MSSILSDHVDDYLRLRRALGCKLERAGHLLPQFIDYLNEADATAITSDLAISWARQATNARLGSSPSPAPTGKGSTAAPTGSRGRCTTGGNEPV